MAVLRSKDKEGDQEYVQEEIQETWESADDWFH
ncbi:TPA: DinI family protein [Kluyvera intermedia]|uniref:DinI family protein n=1 Tax=Kluyvera intermedia TaxID=61648 RepID=A0A9P3TCZ9_KLUIN|nr:DinI-like family protein [Phytobacter ursingii]HAT2206918.1 DinI family protein [Kluyvera intermedia]HAT2517641.1 DinI family protein [Kluyvera intermedia]HAT2605713.1 DinI family protein [Kluyvera intermedia]HAT2682618.1 DinI family protein [Kluyvera intermedia]HAT2699100.1 DinI family protein [Kluyvera intermedia]